MLDKKSAGCYELKEHQLWLDQRCSELLDKKKQAKLQWLQHPSEMNGVDLNSIIHNVSKHFRNKKTDYPVKINWT
jgi:hypothetical protein